MTAEQTTSAWASGLLRVVATVGVVSEAERRDFLERIRECELAQDPDRFERLSRSLLSAEKYTVRVTVSAELADGRVVRARDAGLQVSGWRRGSGAIYRRYRGFLWPLFVNRRLRTYRVQPHDIEDAINHWLGRMGWPGGPAPSVHRWDSLITALRNEHIAVSEADLNSKPLSIVFTREAQQDLFEQR